MTSSKPLLAQLTQQAKAYARQWQAVRQAWAELLPQVLREDIPQNQHGSAVRFLFDWVERKPSERGEINDQANELLPQLFAKFSKWCKPLAQSAAASYVQRFIEQFDDMRAQTRLFRDELAKVVVAYIRRRWSIYNRGKVFLGGGESAEKEAIIHGKAFDLICSWERIGLPEMSISASLDGYIKTTIQNAIIEYWRTGIGYAGESDGSVPQNNDDNDEEERLPSSGHGCITLIHGQQCAALWRETGELLLDKVWQLAGKRVIFNLKHQACWQAMLEESADALPNLIMKPAMLALKLGLDDETVRRHHKIVILFLREHSQAERVRKAWQEMLRDKPDVSYALN